MSKKTTGPTKILLISDVPFSQEETSRISGIARRKNHAIARRTFVTEKGLKLLEEYRSQPDYEPPPGFDD